LTLQGDVKTRWNSTLTMVERNVINKVAILEVFPLLEENALEPTSKQEQKEWKRRLFDLPQKHLRLKSIQLFP